MDATAAFGILSILAVVVVIIWALVRAAGRDQRVERQVEHPGRTSPDSPPLDPGHTAAPNAHPSTDHRAGLGLEDTTGGASKDRLVFLCYRRDDTEDIAGRLNDRLVAQYGSEHVFLDIDSVPLGADFVEYVAQQIARCRIVIVMIGRAWLAVRDKHGQRRLDSADDFVRAEIAAALRQQIPVIPVLVQGAEMPRGDDLPDEIRALVRRNGIELSATRWRTDVERLITELDRVMGG